MDEGVYIEKNGLGFYKDNPEDKVWWVEYIDEEIDGDMLFSFDTEKIYNFFDDYPDNLTKEEKQIFDKENPYWADFYRKHD